MIDVSAIIDDVTKLVGSGCSVVTLMLVYWKALPQIKDISNQTNGLVAQAQAGIHAMGVKEGIEQAASAQVVTAQAISTVVEVAADKIIAAAKLAKEGEIPTQGS